MNSVKCRDCKHSKNWHVDADRYNRENWSCSESASKWFGDCVFTGLPNVNNVNLDILSSCYGFSPLPKFIRKLKESNDE